MAEVYEVLLEKKARGRGFSLTRPWTVRTFKLFKQSLEYYDGDRLKGTVEIAGASCSLLISDEADHKLFPFQVDNGKEKLILNASCEEIRQRCLELFSSAATNPDWTLSPPNPALVAAANLFKVDERAKLEAEEKRLEEERLKNVSDATARQFEEQLANKKLEQAREAERQQREAQEREVANLLVGLGAKARFKTALQAGKLAIARDAAAQMIQGNWRTKIARRKIIIKRAEKERLLREGYARKIQSRYRCRLAKRRVEKAKEAKLQIRKNINAITVQSAWRIYLARKVFSIKQDEKLTLEYSRNLSRQRGLIKTQNLIRAFLAKRRVARIRLHLPTVINVKVIKAEGLNVSDPVHIDPAVIVSGCVLVLPETVSTSYRVNPYKKISDEMIKAYGKTTSHYHVDAISAKTTALVTSLTSMDFVVITVVDRNSPQKDDCLGQALVRVSDIRKQLANQPTTVINGYVEVTIPILTTLLIPIVDEKKESLVTVRRASTGTVTVQVTIADPTYTTCGWLWKVSESLLSNAWKKRWFVLINNELQYYNSDYNLELCKNIIVGKTMTSINQEIGGYKGHNTAMKIAYSIDGKDTHWMLDYDENQSNVFQRYWLRRWYRMASATGANGTSEIQDPDMMKLKAQFGAMKAGTGAAGNGEGKGGKSRVPVSKRMSIFS